MIIKAHHFLYAQICTMVVSSCSGTTMEKPDEVYFTDNITVYGKGAFVPDTIDCEVILADIMGAGNIKCANDLFVIQTNALDNMVHTYSATGDCIGAYCRKGIGPDDFLNADIISLDIDVDGDTCVWVNDISNKQLRRLNISLSRREHTTRTDSVIDTEFAAINAVIAGDMLVYELMDNDSYKLKYRNLKDNSDSVHVEQMYVYPTDDFYLFSGCYDLSPDNRHAVIAMHNINQVNIIDLSDMSRKAVSLGNVMSYDNYYDKEKQIPLFSAYGDVACGKDHIYAIYYGQMISDTDNSADNGWSTIHSINYDGTIDKVYVIDREILSIASDATTGELYGRDDNDNIIRLNIK